MVIMSFRVFRDCIIWGYEFLFYSRRCSKKAKRDSFKKATAFRSWYLLTGTVTGRVFSGSEVTCDQMMVKIKSHLVLQKKRSKELKTSDKTHLGAKWRTCLPPLFHISKQNWYGTSRNLLPADFPFEHPTF